MKLALLVFTLGLPALLSVIAACPATAERTPLKKPIEYGWDTPTPEFAREPIREIEMTPSDGLMFRTPGLAAHFATVPVVRRFPCLVAASRRPRR